MPANFDQAYYDFLTGDVTLVGLLAQYKGKPAVFSPPAPPAEAVLPWVFTFPVTEAPGFYSKQASGWTHERQIGCYVSRRLNRSALTVEEIAGRVKEIIEETPTAISVTGYSVVDFRVTNTIVNDDDETLGRVLSTELWVA